MLISDDKRGETNNEEFHHRVAALGDRLSVIVDRFGLGTIAKETRKSSKQIKRYCEGAEPPFRVLTDVVDFVGVSYDWLASGRSRTHVDHELSGELSRRELDSLLSLDRTNMSNSDISTLDEEVALLRSLIAAEDEWMKLASRNHRLRAQDSSVFSEMTNLPVYSVEASAGLGLPVGDEIQMGVVAFDRGFLKDRGANPDQCSVITASGDSMQPAIPDGSMLVVDHSQTEVKNGLIMVVNVGDDLLVKRIRRRLDGLIDLISDNPLYPPETLGPNTLEQLRVVGRVVYFCRTP
ncbi:S24 family peptidase [Thalassovita sp.]|uniref:S24 family peptidase n=1 Tax=Thalassovita sp. TaxID=1979401 RepID=UPI002B26ADB2|nr:S24 family peptidase [Thalassovita sp.]